MKFNRCTWHQKRQRKKENWERQLTNTMPCTLLKPLVELCLNRPNQSKKHISNSPRYVFFVPNMLVGIKNFFVFCKRKKLNSRDYIHTSIFFKKQDFIVYRKRLRGFHRKARRNGQETFPTLWSNKKRPPGKVYKFLSNIKTGIARLPENSIIG